MTKTEPGARNIFNITEPERYRCQVYHYHSRLSRLYLRVFKEQNQQPSFYLLFSDVAYFDCPVTWQGAQFDIAEYDECLQLMLDSGLVGQAILRFPGAYASLTEYTRLYRAPGPPRPIQIIAGSGSLLQRLPNDLG
ncbi:hypothetical protein G4Y79_24010 [Phototrophicus methaneseepsis]|uniref:Uncharacterized protein n=1 Tax=Phototrophicus methaneseepsis TaxID=2710758 RepID=A0A7S8E9A6_9CHLR|nr:hypothetical protein [Phototrophicus methaneseepsis]QPC82712.1 hypothetical protein G4Y79_24010 [Phototrophicus methaneseepsis]